VLSSTATGQLQSQNEYIREATKDKTHTKRKNLSVKVIFIIIIIIIVNGKYYFALFCILCMFIYFHSLLLTL
jgi:hypothetical protein